MFLGNERKQLLLFLSKISESLFFSKIEKNTLYETRKLRFPQFSTVFHGMWYRSTPVLQTSPNRLIVDLSLFFPKWGQSFVTKSVISHGRRRSIALSACTRTNITKKLRNPKNLPCNLSTGPLYKGFLFSTFLLLMPYASPRYDNIDSFYVLHMPNDG